MEPEEMEMMGNQNSAGPDPMASEEEASVSQKGLWDGPIPGENYTSDTKNYPWHRPPEFTDYDKAIEHAAKRLTSEKGSIGILTMIENGIPVSTLAQTFLMSGVGAGKWTLDYALLMAGPVAHIMCLMANAYDIPYELGVEGDPMPTRSFFKGLEEVNKPKAQKAGKEAMKQIDQVKKPSSGFMSMGSPKEEY